MLSGQTRDRSVAGAKPIIPMTGGTNLKTSSPNLGVGDRAGKPLDPGRTYKVAGWASVNPQPDELPDIWDVVAEYLRDRKVIRDVTPNIPRVKGIGSNPGFVA